MMRRLPVRANVTGVILVLFSLAALLVGQEFRASISGHIVDASGARIPQAKVEITSLATKETAHATTDSSGSYTIPLLRPGQYTLTVTAAAFKQFCRPQGTPG